MDIYWPDPLLKRNLESAQYLKGKYDKKVAVKLAQRLVELGDADTYAEIPPAAHPHPSPYPGIYAVDVPGVGEKRGKLRLLFRPKGKYDSAHLKTITAIEIIGLKNYH